jgi:hypothetical protein
MTRDRPKSQSFSVQSASTRMFAGCEVCGARTRKTGDAVRTQRSRHCVELSKPKTQV